MEGKKEKKRNVRHLDSDSEESGKDEKVEYEDPFVDELEEEELVEDDIEEDEEGGLPDEYIEKYKNLRISDKEFIEEKNEEEENEEKLEPYLPKSKNEKLEFRNKAYTMFHRLDLEWPSLCIDVVKDDQGYNRTKFPLSCLCVLGTQADKDEENKILVLKLQELHRTEFDSDEENEVEEDDLDDEPLLTCKTIPQKCAVNRIRSMPQKPNILASLGSNGTVSFYDISIYQKALHEGEAKHKLMDLKDKKGNLGSLRTSKMKDEGFALDWSPINPGVLAVGDCSGGIKIITVPQDGKWNEEKFESTTGSIEDIRWSSEFKTVFATCSNDKTVKIWDTRKQKPAFSFQASDTDINAISWNQEVKNFLASGDDNGMLRVWDLRQLEKKQKIDPVAQFKYHQEQITSVEWNPNDSSVIACCAGDNKTTVWDLSVESDDSIETYGLPPQLMFIHQGQEGVKEVKWHPQLPHVILTCSYDSMNIFKPTNFHDEEDKVEEEEEEEELFVKKGDDSSDDEEE